MGVLESMRSSSDSTFMQVVLVLVIISFVFWYAVPQGDTTTVVATVNGERIMETEYRNLYSSVKNSREVQLQRALTNPEEQSLGESVRQQLVEMTVVRQQAASLGIEVSEYEIARYIADIPGLLDDEGGIDREKYDRFLKRQGVTEAIYQERVRDQLIFQKVADLVSAGTTISEPVLRRTYENSQRKLDITYVRIRPSAFYTSIQPTDAELDKWLEENDALARETYDKDFERLYKHPEQLHLSVIRLALGTGEGSGVADLLPKMNAVREELLAGGDFAELAKKWSEHPSAEKGGDMELKPVLQLSVEVTDAVKDLAVGDFSRVITSESDLRIYKLHERIDPYEESFDDVKRKIAERLIREDQAPVLAAKFAEEELLPKWKESGEVPSDLLAPKMLSPQQTGLVPASGMGFGGPPPDVMAAAAEAPAGTVLDQVFESQGVLWVAQVTGREEADLAAFEANREQIAARELITRRQTVFSNWVTDAVSHADVK
ncbi:MAG: SurA N-terminal domain-containing protein [Alphaproteobacteria bacterium]|nr:SurA N-terminal domain-containing protein [Alphaproteobacteria bacterium]